MCEFEPDCTKKTETVAAALAKAPREDLALLIVTCPKRHHLLAAVYDLSDRGVVLCSPHMKARHGSMFKPDPGIDPNRIVHWHPALQALEGLEGTQYGRCRCGTWHYKPQAIRDELAKVTAGEWEGVLADAFVKVRNDATGQVSTLSRTYAEAYVLPEGGHTIIGKAPQTQRTRRPYIHGSYVEMADSPTNGTSTP